MTYSLDSKLPDIATVSTPSDQPNQTPNYNDPLVTLTPRRVEVINARTFKFVSHLQNLHRREVGFLPTMALREYQARQQLWMSRENGQPCGYLAWGSFRGKRPVRDPYHLRIIQACIDYDAQRSTHGTQLVRNLETLATTAGIESVGLWCADDLPANRFWQQMGFKNDATRTGGSSLIKDRQHRHWIKWMDVPIRAPFKQALLDLPWSPTGPRRRR